MGVLRLLSDKIVELFFWFRSDFSFGAFSCFW